MLSVSAAAVFEVRARGNAPQSTIATLLLHQQTAVSDVMSKHTMTFNALVVGDGFNCTQTLQLSTLPQKYSTQGPGKLACLEGQDVAYPTTAPGYIDDPTGYSDTRNGFGSRLPVTWQECAGACEMSGQCDSFAYNPYQQMCFLKKDGSTNTCTSQPQKCKNSQDEDFDCGTWQTYYKVG